MDLSPTAIVRVLLPRIPLLISTAILNALSLSPNASKQELSTELTVVLIRSLFGVKRTIGQLQHLGRKDPGIKGPIMIAKTTIPAPAEENGPRDALVRAIKELGNGSEVYTLPEIVDVQAEWTGHRPGVSKNEPRLDLPERDQYDVLMGNVSNETTILYFHGGAYIMMDPSSHRQPVAALARKTGGRCLSVRYRLAPQNPFPAQLLDALIAYLSLLAPQPGAFHQAVHAKKVVFAGDSAGANLAISLLQLLLTLQRMGIRTIRFHGADVPVELPAGISTNSCWADISFSLPSTRKNAQYDYLQPPAADGLSTYEPLPDKHWPSEPPRAEMLCNWSMLAHPLVSPLAASAELWKGMPPAWFCLGNEGLEDEITVLARRMHQAGAVVQFVGYEGMPHCFSMIFPTSVKGKDCFGRQVKFIQDVTEGQGPSESDAVWVTAFSNPPEAKTMDFGHISKLTDVDVFSSMQTRVEYARRREEEALAKWTEPQTRAKL
jgi:acetyl esterase/lipase